MQQPQRLLGKSDFKLLYGMVIGAHIVVGLIFKFELPIIIIALCSILVSFAIAFIKLFKKPESKKSILLDLGCSQYF